MLMLTRKCGESVDLSVRGEVICNVKVLELLDSAVRLDFDADEDIQINRGGSRGCTEFTRRRGEFVDLLVGGEVICVVKVLEFMPDGITVRLGFDADRQIDITRDNIKERKDGYEESEGESESNGNR